MRSTLRVNIMIMGASGGGRDAQNLGNLPMAIPITNQLQDFMFFFSKSVRNFVHTLMIPFLTINVNYRGLT